jgi:hypothetical protein
MSTARKRPNTLTEEQYIAHEVEIAMGNGYSHYAPMEADTMAEFMAHREPVATLCGATWIPTRMPREGDYLCPRCEEMYATGVWKLAPSRATLAKRNSRSLPYKIARFIGLVLLYAVCIVIAVPVVMIQGALSVRR